MGKHQIEQQKRARRRIAITVLLFALLGVMIFVGYYLLKSAVRSVSQASNAVYQRTSEKVIKETEDSYYQMAFTKAEKENHVSNDIVLSIGNMREQSRLEVLQVGDVEFVSQNGNDSTDNITAWAVIPGSGTYTVDFTRSEFIIDNEHHYILARIPKPELTSCNLDINGIKIYKVDKEGLGNGSYQEGVMVAQNQLKEAYRELECKLSEDQENITTVQDSARKLISQFIKNLNSKVTDLIVEVEFIDA